jgi:hypothetical protein
MHYKVAKVEKNHFCVCCGGPMVVHILCCDEFYFVPLVSSVPIWVTPNYNKTLLNVNKMKK